MVISEKEDTDRGSALAQVYKQVGTNLPTSISTTSEKAFHLVQKLISDDLILSGHDRSDGGLIVTLLEMAFGGNCGLEVDIAQKPYA